MKLLPRVVLALAAAAGLAAASVACAAESASRAGPATATAHLRHRPLLVGFYVPWDDKARRSLTAHIGQLDVFAPLWVTLTGADENFRVADDPEALAILGRARTPPAVLPLVANAHDGIWDAAAAERVILDGDARARFLAGLAETAARHGYAGFVFDFEGLSPAAVAGYPAFLKQARAALSGAGRETWATVPIVAADWPMAALSAAADSLVLMGYDQCWASSTPGPIAGDDWLAAVLPQRLQALDPSRTVVALGSYAYDWPSGAPASVISVGEARALAARAGATVAREPGSDAGHFAYADAARTPHAVWFADAGDFDVQKALAIALHARGVALWRLGLEDPAIWTDRAAAPIPAGPLPPAACAPLRPPAPPTGTDGEPAAGKPEADTASADL